MWHAMLETVPLQWDLRVGSFVPEVHELETACEPPLHSVWFRTVRGSSRLPMGDYATNVLQGRASFTMLKGEMPGRVRKLRVSLRWFSWDWDAMITFERYIVHVRALGIRLKILRPLARANMTLSFEARPDWDMGISSSSAMGIGIGFKFKTGCWENTVPEIWEDSDIVP